jgi:hypothetical protein
VLELEEPSTYQELISQFLAKPGGYFYERIRLLPGIEPQLRAAITQAAKESLPSRLVADYKDYQSLVPPFGIYLFAAKQGDPAALQAILEIFNAHREHTRTFLISNLDYIFMIPKTPDSRDEEVSGWLTGKSAASFRFDPLLRLWKLLP